MRKEKLRWNSFCFKAAPERRQRRREQLLVKSVPGAAATQNDHKSSITTTTRKLCCRKDDRAMRPIGYMDALNFRDSRTTPTATIPNIFHGLLFRSTL